MSEQNQLLNMVNFIQLRQQQKNSLSIFKKNIQINTKGKSNFFNEKVNNLFTKIDEQIQEGHTIFSTNIDNETLQKWQKLGFLTVIENNHYLNINTPIIMQQIDNEQIFWLHRQWFAEKQLAMQLLQIANRPTENFAIDMQLLNEQLNEQQRQAVISASQYGLSIIIGGPGTGKTFTIAKLVTYLQQLHDKQREIDPNLPPLSIALTAPTGKAGQRMQESLLLSLANEPIKIDLPEAKTLHRLLGIGTDGVPRYHAKNPLPDDLVIVDEASMLGLELASQLVNAIKPNGRLILLGDANQLSAVDAGSVLSDLCQVEKLQPYRTELLQSKRFDNQSIIGKFANALNIPCQNETEKTQKIAEIHGFLQPNGQVPFIKIHTKTDFSQVYHQLAEPYFEFFALMKTWYKHSVDIENVENIQTLFKIFNQYRILSAGHQGKLGAKNLNQMMSNAFYQHSQLTKTQGFFYHGLPVMIAKNDYQLGLFNGDIGICLLVKGKLWVCFPEKNILASRLSIENCEPAFVMTIHKSQGSEFDCVAVCLDVAHQRLLSQELVYTAVTRSKQNLMIVASQNVLDEAITKKGNRQTGLALHF